MWYKQGLEMCLAGSGGCVGGVCVSLPLLGKECVPAGLLAWDEDEDESETYGAEPL